jgi:N-acetylglutamate synthase-like GNAT family acetyltransferase
MMDDKENTGALAWAQEAALPAVLTLLETCALPTEGVDAVLTTMLVAYEGERLIGCAALEVYGTVALLRSVAIHPAYRSRMLGQHLVQTILDHARSLRIREVYLLTETASEYFPRFGFRLIGRSAVAPAIQHSVEWTSVCPVSAQAMVLHLDAA